jgi:hypothetical protein
MVSTHFTVMEPECASERASARVRKEAERERGGERGGREGSRCLESELRVLLLQRRQLVLPPLLLRHQLRNAVPKRGDFAERRVFPFMKQRPFALHILPLPTLSVLHLQTISHTPGQ